MNDPRSKDDSKPADQSADDWAEGEQSANDRASSAEVEETHSPVRKRRDENTE